MSEEIPNFSFAHKLGFVLMSVMVVFLGFRSLKLVITDIKSASFLVGLISIVTGYFSQIIFHWLNLKGDTQFNIQITYSGKLLIIGGFSLIGLILLIELVSVL